MKTPDRPQILPDDDLFQWAENNRGHIMPEDSVLDNELGAETMTTRTLQETLAEEEPYCPMCQNGGFCIKHQPGRTGKKDNNFFVEDPYEDVNRELLLASQHPKPEVPMTKEEIAEMFVKFQEDLDKLS